MQSNFDKINLNLFKVIDIAENNKDILKYSCMICKRGADIISVFNDCEHYCCTECLDNLYDNYKYNNYNKDEVMFICTLCNSKVYDILYKN